MTSKIDDAELIDIMLQQAKLFLDDSREFYPFGAAMTRNSQIVTVGVQLDNDYPSSQEVLEFLVSGINDSLAQGKYIVAAIGINVSLTRGGLRQDAIEIRILRSNCMVEKLYYTYQEVNGMHEFAKVDE